MWASDMGDHKYRLGCDYLTPNSLVFDIGGYMGDWASHVFSKYLCNIWIFEPVPIYFSFIKSRFANNKNINVFNFGFDNKTVDINVEINNDATSVFFNLNKGNKVKIRLEKISRFLKEKKVNKIDLMKINCEGGEYGLLENLMNSGFINKVNNLQIQFHEIDKDSSKEMQRLKRVLEKTHKCIWTYPCFWEGWSRK